MKHLTLWTIFSVFLGIAGYGYWHARSHAYLHISVWDRPESVRAQLVSSATLILLDKGKNQIARFDAQPPYGNFEVTEPKAYSCSQAEKDAASSTDARDAWRACHKRYSTWLATTIERVTYADLATGRCAFRDMPVAVKKFDDYSWMLWWVPLVHVGGKPYSYFNIDIAIDLRRCAVVAY